MTLKYVWRFAIAKTPYRLLRVKLKAESIPEYQELTEVNAMLAERLTD